MAKRKRRRSKQLVLNMAGQDTGGQCHRVKEALGLYSNKYYARNFVLGTTYLNYPVDIVYGLHNPDEVRNLFNSASVLHIHNKHMYYWKWGKTPEPIPSIIHQHGRFPSSVKIEDIKKADKSNKSLRIISTLNLLKWVDNDPSLWLPSPINFDLYNKMTVEKEKIEKGKIEKEKIKICHCPTDRRLKHTELLIDTVNKLKQNHPEVELILVEGKPHSEVIEIKLTCDIGFDQLLLWYGNNAIEFWSLGIPCIVGMSDTTRDASKKLFGYEPWIYANEQSLYKAIEELVSDKSYRETMGKMGKDHIKRYHSYPAVTTKLENIYDKAKGLFNK